MVCRLEIGGRAAPKPWSTGGKASLARAVPGLFAFLLLLGFVVQGTAVQTHLHFAGQASPQPVASGDRYAQAAKPNKDSPATCPLCQEAAMAGAYLLPQATLLPPPPAAVVSIAVATIRALALPTPAHGWQSRAPPQ